MSELSEWIKSDKYREMLRKAIINLRRAFFECPTCGKIKSFKSPPTLRHLFQVENKGFDPFTTPAEEFHRECKDCAKKHRKGRRHFYSHRDPWIVSPDNVCRVSKDTKQWQLKLGGQWVKWPNDMCLKPYGNGKTSI